MSKSKYWKMAALAALAALVAFAWQLTDRQPAPDSVIATPSKEVQNLPKVAVPIKKPVKVYSGGSTLKKNLDLPADVVQDDAQQILASSKVNGEQQLTITTVLNTETGESQTFYRKDARPWLASNDRIKRGLYAVYKNGIPTASFQVRRGLFSVKSFDFVGVAGVDYPMSGAGSFGATIGIGVEF